MRRLDKLIRAEFFPWDSAVPSRGSRNLIGILFGVSRSSRLKKVVTLAQPMGAVRFITKSSLNVVKLVNIRFSGPYGHSIQQLAEDAANRPHIHWRPILCIADHKFRSPVPPTHKRYRLPYTILSLVANVRPRLFV